MKDKYIWPISHWNFSFQSFDNKTNTKRCNLAKFASSIEPFHNLGYVISLPIQKFQKPLMGALKSDFSWKIRVLQFCGKILVEKYIRPNRPWNLLSKHFRDQTNSKLWWWAEFAIYIEIYIFQLRFCHKIAKIWYFGWNHHQNLPKEDFQIFGYVSLQCNTISEKSRCKSQIPLATKVLN